MELLIGFFLQIFSGAGIIVLFGSIIALLRRAFCSVAGMSGPKILLLTGIVGTPVHELSHALMCLIFGHKITEIKLYQPGSTDGTLGYVKHQYNKRNIYHQIGNFFIGVAPIVLGCAVILLLLFLLLPDTFDAVMEEIGAINSGISDLPISEYFSFVLTSIRAIFSSNTFSEWKGWVFLILALMIASHTEMSIADIKSGAKGFGFIAVILFAVDLILFFILPDVFSALTGILTSFALVLSAFLSVSVIFLLVLLLIAIVFKFIGMIFTR